MIPAWWRANRKPKPNHDAQTANQAPSL